MENEPVNDIKIINVVIGRVARGLHHRHVTQSVTLTADNDNLSPADSIDRNIIEAIADGSNDLLKKAHNSIVNSLHGSHVIDTSGASIRQEPSLRVMIVDAEAFALLGIGWGLLGYEFYITGLEHLELQAELSFLWTRSYANSTYTSFTCIRGSHRKSYSFVNND